MVAITIAVIEPYINKELVFANALNNYPSDSNIKRTYPKERDRSIASSDRKPLEDTVV
jgi:hypothetical protein